MTLSTAADPLGHRGLRPVRIPATGPPSGLARAQLEALTGVVEDLAGQFELRPLLERILWHAADLLGCRSGSICTVDERAGTYRKDIDLGVSCRSGDQFPLTEGVTGEIVRAGGPVTFAEYADVRGGHIDPADRADLHATIGVPIRWAGAVIGTCIVFSNDPARTFGPQDVTLLELFAGHAGLAIVNARMHAQAADLARAEATGLERERIVRDVHDSVARALATVILHLGKATSPDHDGDRNHLQLARDAARTALVETRRIVLGVRPGPPQAPTIEQAIGSQVTWAKGTGLDIRLVVAGPPQPLPPEVTDELFGLAQQAISAVVAHGDARTARVGLVYRAAEVVLLIQDDGIGFDLDAVPRPDGSRSPTLHHIDEIVSRAEHLGGTVQVDAIAGWGTTIRAAIPYRPVPADPPARCTVLLVAHRPLIRAGVLALLAQNAETVQVIGEIDGSDSTVDAYRLLQPDVVLIDIELASGAAAATGQLREHDPHAAVVAIGDNGPGDPRLRSMVQAGARGAVMLDADGPALARAIGAAARGDALFTDEVLHGLYNGSGIDEQATALTSREREVRRLVTQGLPDKQIADLLHISVKTVEKHVGSALRKTGARNRTELAGMTVRGAAPGTRDAR
jgi:DNA-binding NarL/FixJ family response regulator/signal transduction histidine kinase